MGNAPHATPAMAASITDVETDSDPINRKALVRVRTDAGKTYVFEKFEDSPRPFRLARRGKGMDAREACSTRSAPLPRNVERVANAHFGPDGWEK